MMQQNDRAAMNAAYEAVDQRTKAANKAVDDATSAANRVKDEAARRTNSTADQFAEVNFTELDNRNFQKLKAERDAASRNAATKLHDAME